MSQRHLSLWHGPLPSRSVPSSWWICSFNHLLSQVLNLGFSASLSSPAWGYWECFPRVFIVCSFLPQSPNFAFRISVLPFCMKFVPKWTRLFPNTSWKPVQTPVRSAALVLAVKSPCNPLWGHSPTCLFVDGRNQLQARIMVLQRCLSIGRRPMSECAKRPGFKYVLLLGVAYYAGSCVSPSSPCQWCTDMGPCSIFCILASSLDSPMPKSLSWVLAWLIGNQNQDLERLPYCFWQKALDLTGHPLYILTSTCLTALLER